MQEINFIRPQEVYDRNTGESKVRYRSYDGNDRFIPVVDGEKGVPKTMVEVTHAELKAMRDNGKLTAGALYRITDYQCTTTQENTRSAGHQFDIVLLALSENKLAEEGWAMMHDNIYDVTFSDGVTKKCYAYIVDEYNHLNVVSIETLLGIEGLDGSEYNINESGKNIIISGWESSELISEDVPYNYFQNSNLSAWKVWYCLDNDKSRFAWAMDIQPESAIFYIDGNNPVTRYQEGDLEEGGEHYYAWQTDIHSNFYTLNEKPSTGDDVYDSALDVSGNVVSYSPSNEGTGVIYRLIDEFNNDVAYDFKNIQYVRKLTDGEYDPNNGENTWVYTFTAYDIDNNVCLDCSMINGRDNIVNETEFCANNTIKAYIKTIDSTVKYALSNNSVVLPLSRENEDIPVILSFFIDGGSHNNTFGHCESISLINCSQCSFSSFFVVTVYYANGRSMSNEDIAIFLDNKKVLTES